MLHLASRIFMLFQFFIIKRFDSFIYACRLSNFTITTLTNWQSNSNLITYLFEFDNKITLIVLVI